MLNSDTRRKQISKDVRDILKALDILNTCCDTIEECGGCRECPLYLHCLKEASVYDTLEDVTTMRWEEFVGFADDVEEIMEEISKTPEERWYEGWWNEQERRWEEARDERTIAENHGW